MLDYKHPSRLLGRYSWDVYVINLVKVLKHVFTLIFLKHH